MAPNLQIGAGGRTRSYEPRDFGRDLLGVAPHEIDMLKSSSKI
jgi:hypothetical protein